MSIILISYPIFLGDFIRTKLGLAQEDLVKNPEKIDFEIEESVVDQYNEALEKGLFNLNVDVFDEDADAIQKNGDKVKLNDLVGEEFLNKVRGKKGFEEVIGYIEIPAIKERILLFYGTSDHALERGAGILENTSMPSHKKGGIHTVLAGHRGMTNLNVFRFVDKLKDGDLLHIYLSGDVYTYKKTGMNIREPGKLDDVYIHPDKNLLTIVTCHPYLINNKRMLVYFEKVEK